MLLSHWTRRIKTQILSSNCRSHRILIKLNRCNKLKGWVYKFPLLKESCWGIAQTPWQGQGRPSVCKCSSAQLTSARATTEEGGRINVQGKFILSVIVLYIFLSLARSNSIIINYMFKFLSELFRYFYLLTHRHRKLERLWIIVATNN